MRRPRPHWLLGLNAWGTLKCRGAISTAIALGIDLAVDKYESLGDDGATHAGIVSDRLIHRFSDVTAIAFTAMDSSCYMGLYLPSLSDANLFCDQVRKCLVGIEQRRCLSDEVNVAILAELPV